MSTIAVIFIAVAASTALFILLLYLTYRREKQDWNQGYCSDCGEEWHELRFENSHIGRVFRCKNGHIIKITFKNIVE